MVRYYYNLRLHRYYYVIYLPLLVFHHPLELTQRQFPPSPLPPYPTPHHTTPPHYSPHFHLSLLGHPYTWTFPGSYYPMSLPSVSLVSPPASTFATTVVSTCLPHVSRLDPLARPSQSLIHSPLNYPLFLHPVRNITTNSRQWYHTICGTI